MNRFLILCCTMLLFGASTAWGQGPKEANYDEMKVPSYELPDVLMTEFGEGANQPSQWELKRRPKVLEMLAREEYGYTPTQKLKVKYELVREDRMALDGKATARQVMLTFSRNGREVKALLLAYTPNGRKGRLPVFVSYNFRGNHCLTHDPDILYSPYFQRVSKDDPDLLRGTQVSRWPLERILARGFAVVTMCYQDIFPDNPQGGPESVTQLFDAKWNEGESRWQAIGAWAWGYSRMADWVIRQPWADKKRLIVLGHSRLGKTALWAGAQDERFGVVISNNSGCGGAALSKREFGERVAQITKTFPHWFCPAFAKYGWKERDLPFDQHWLLALIAPRHLYVASAEDDKWADPYGEYLAAYEASRVWRKIYRISGLIRHRELPTVNQPTLYDQIISPVKGKQTFDRRVEYHIRSGKHDITIFDWECYMDFCEIAFAKKNFWLNDAP